MSYTRNFYLIKIYKTDIPLQYRRSVAIKVVLASIGVNSRCRYQSITQQYLKSCLIKDDSNYMFQPIAAIVRFSSESMVVVLYRIGVVMSRW